MNIDPMLVANVPTFVPNGQIKSIIKLFEMIVLSIIYFNSIYFFQKI